MVLVLHSNAKILVLPPPKSCLGDKSRPEGKTIPISGGTPTYLYCTELISQLKKNKQAREMYFEKPLYGYFYILLLPLDGKSSDQQVKRRKHPKAYISEENINVYLLFQVI